ncbi:BspA family leucine-rich repeat surface protein [Lactobacillus crispatus]|uniref:BspA family leucine-rich repeat surface protein n=1 Tax=Lactobacillus crispatus TaxID=47770 RepID=UPI0030F9CE4F
MFGDDTALTDANVANWSFNNNANLTGLFGGSTGDYSLQSVYMSNMDLSKVSCLNQIFQNDKSLTSVDFRNTKFADKATTAWMFSGQDTSKINIQLSGAKNIPKDVFDTFKNAAKTQKVDKIDLSNASLSSEVTGSGLLSGLSDVKQIDVTKFDISHVTDMTNMFSGDTNLTKITGLSTWNVGNVTSMNSMFAGDTALTNLDLSNWKPLKVTNMAAMFKGCSGLKSITLNWGTNTQSVQNFSEMFSGDSSLTEVNGLSGWNVSNATDFRWMFTNDTSLTEINGLSGWDVSNATQLSNMFSGDSSLKSMDLSNWKTSKVTDLSNLFNGDTALQTVNMSNMDLRNVNNFNFMFIGATSLSKIDFRNTRFLDSDKIQSYYFNSTNPIVELSGAQKVPKFLFDMLKSSKAKTIDLRNTSLASNITDLSTAFYNDQAVEEIDMTGFDTSHITDMNHMFANCSALTSLNLSWGGNTKNVKNFAWMFANDNNLQTIDGIGEWNVSNATDMNHMFSDDTALTNLDLSNWKPLKVTNMATMFKGCSGLKSITLNWGTNTQSVQNFSEMFSGDSSLTEVNGLSGWNVSNATDMTNMFSGDTALTNLDLSNWKPLKVTNMAAMFKGCSGLKSITLNWGTNTQSVQNFSEMFRGDSSLTEVKGLSDWKVSNATNLTWMFTDDSALESMDLSNWKTSKVTDLSNLFNGDTALQTVNMSNMDLRNVNNFNFMFIGATSLSKIDFRNTRFLDSDKIQSYYFNSTNPIVELSGAQKVPKFLFDMLKSSNAKTIDLRNTSLATNITNLSTAFNDQAVEEIDMTGFDTSHITNMSNMFNGANHLKTIIGIEGWDVSKVTDMNHMFANDNNLQTIDGIGEWNVSNATDMTNMFSGDTALTNLDLSNWEPLKVTNMAAMFKGCSGLKSITLNWGTNTQNVQNFSEMFANDNNLQTIDGIGEWSVSNATDISHMFACINLDSNPSTNYKYNFAQPQYCGSLTSLDLSNWGTGKVTNMEAVFWGQKSLTTVGNFSKWNTGNVTNMRDLFAGCENLKFNNTALDNLTKWNTSNVTNMRALFADMRSQTDLSCVQSWDTHKVQDMSYMFFRDSTLTSVGNLATRGNVWNTSQVGTLPGNLQNYGMSNMFAGCTSLVKIDGINSWDVSHVTKMRSMFYNTALLKSLDLSKWDTSSLQMADKMFFGSGVTDLNLNGWDFNNLKLHADNGMIDNDQNNTIRGSEYMFGNLLHPCTINMTGITLPSQQKETFDVIDFFGADDRPLVVFSPELAQLNLNEESWNFTNKSLLPVEILNLFSKENAKGRQNSNYLTYYRNDDPNKTPIAYQKLNFIFKDKQAQKAQTMALMFLMALPTGQASVSQSPDFDEYLKQVTTVDQIKQLLGPDLAKLWDWKADTKNGSLTKIPGAQPIDQVCAKVGLTFIDGNATQTYTRTIIAKYSDDKPNETLATQTATFSDPYIDNDGNKVWGKHTSWTEFIAPTKAGYDANPASITGVDKPTKDDTAYIMYTKKAVTPDKPVTPPDDNPDQPVTPPDQPDKPSQPVTPSDKPETPSNQPNKAHNDNQSEPSTPASNGKYKKQKGYERNSGIHGEKVSRNKRHLTGVKGQPFGLKHKAAAQNTSTKSNGKATQTKLPQTDAKDNKALSLLGLSLAGITVLLGTIVERKHR